jgi:hypothetical protein
MTAHDAAFVSCQLDFEWHRRFQRRKAPARRNGWSGF